MLIQDNTSLTLNSTGIWDALILQSGVGLETEETNSSNFDSENGRCMKFYKKKTCLFEKLSKFYSCYIV